MMKNSMRYDVSQRVAGGCKAMKHGRRIPFGVASLNLYVGEDGKSPITLAGRLTP